MQRDPGGNGKAAARGSELAVHGIDAWRDVRAGRAEMRQLTSITGQETAGVRMHWLYFATDSPRRLEAAGFDYDSTWGYNDAVGYRAGTSQVFRLPGAQDLMELPLSIMDSALFYRGRMDLARRRTRCRTVRRIVANARRFGGTRRHQLARPQPGPRAALGPLLPASCWKRSARATGSGLRPRREAVDWFRWRRSIRFTARRTRTSSQWQRRRRAWRFLPAACGSTVQRRTSAAALEELRFDGRHAGEGETVSMRTLGRRNGGAERHRATLGVRTKHGPAERWKRFVCMIAYTNYAIDARVRREAETLASHGFQVRCLDHEERSGHVRDSP